MTWNGNGTFNPPIGPEFPAVTGELIKASNFNAVIQDLCDAFLNTLPRDGQAPVGGDLDFGGTYRPKNLPAASANGQAVRYQEYLALLNAVIALAAPGDTIFNKGNSGTALQTIDFSVASGQILTATGAFVMGVTNMPVGRLSGVLLKAVNFGTQMSSAGIIWKKADGTETTTFAASGYTLQTTGTNFIALISYGDGVTYGFVR